MNCPLEDRNGPELILAYVSESLETETAALFEIHMSACPACRAFAQSQQSVWTALDAFETAPISDDFNRRLYQRIEQPVGLWQRITDSFRRPWVGNTWVGNRPVRHFLPLAAAASLLLVAVAVWERPAPKPAQSPNPLSAQIEAIQPEQMESALDDMEMVRDFIHPVSSESDSKM